MNFSHPLNVLLVLYNHELIVHYEPIETTQCFGQSNGATVNHASDHRRAQDERQLWLNDLPAALYEGLTVNKQRGVYGR